MRTDKWLPVLLVGLLAVQTFLLAVVILRLNEIQRLVSMRDSGSPGPVVSDEVIQVDPGDGPAKGPADAPVTLVEFSCFTCPSCADLQPALREVLSKYEGRVRLAFRYFPLGSQGKPILLATAAECANRQGRFWEAQDVLFQKSRDLSSTTDVAAALQKTGLDMEAFGRCVGSEEAVARVQSDFEAGRKYGVDATPTLFLNGRRVLGADAADLSRLIEAEL